MTPLLREAFAALGLTPEAMKSGSLAVNVLTLQGHPRQVTLTVPVDQAERIKLMGRYAASGDAVELVSSLIEPAFRDVDFLNSLAPSSLAQLANVSIGLMVGPEQLEAMIGGQLPESERFGRN